MSVPKSRLYYMMISHDVNRLGLSGSRKQTIIYGPIVKEFLTLPSEISLCLTIEVDISPYEFESMLAEIRDPDDEVIATANYVDIFPERFKKIFESKDNDETAVFYGRFSVRSGLQRLKLEKYGEYKTALRINGVEQGSYSFIIEEDDEGEES